jgi:hypothetical protein
MSYKSRLVANPATQWLVDESRCIVAISHCLVVSSRDCEKMIPWLYDQLYNDPNTMVQIASMIIFMS